MIKWHRTYYSMIATPLTVGDLVMSTLGFVMFRVGTVSAVFILVMAPFGVFTSWWGVVVAFFVQLLIGLAFATPLYALSATMKDETAYGIVFRLGMIPLFLFSGAFFPISNLSPAMELFARVTPLWQGVDLTRMLVLGDVDWPVALVHVVYLVVLAGCRLVADRAPPAPEADRDMSVLNRAIGQQSGAHLSLGESTGLLLLRNYIAYRGAWWLFVTGFLEPVFYLFSIGVGVGQLVTGFEFNGEVIPYAEFVAPGMLAASAMNGALLDSTFNFFFKLKYNKLFDQMLATPLTTTDVARGELTWSLLRGGIYSLAFLIVMVAMGLVGSWWAVLAVPAALLIGFAFGGACMALTTYMRSWQDFDYVTLGTLPLFLFSATFFPITAFPTWLQWVVELTPLYRGVVLVRELTTGVLTWGSAVSVVYLLAMGLLGLAVVGRRLDKLLLT